MIRHVLVEISGGVLVNAIFHCEDNGMINLWVRDYDDLKAQGYSDEEAKKVPPILYEGKIMEPPKSFTK